MQFDRKLVVRVGGAIVAAIVLGLYQLMVGGFGGSDQPKPETRSSTPVVAEQTTADEPTRSTPTPARSTRSDLPAPQGEFDYYVLVLSWSPTHCSGRAGRGRDDDMQCRSGRPFGFVLHGLWPQYERGYPQACESDEPREVSSSNMDRALKVAPSENLVQHEWEKHGTCAGLAQDDYFSTAIAAYSSVAVPSTYKLPAEPIETTPDDVREAFLAANNSLSEDDVSATCSRNELAEVWVCLDKSLKPRACSADVAKRHCGARHVRMRAVRGDWP